MKIFLILLFISMQVHASEKYALIIGGGGEDPQKKESTIFDDEVFVSTSYFNSPYFKDENVEIIYDGGHSKTTKDLKYNFPTKSIKPFSKKTFADLMDKYFELINSNKIKSGDSLMIVIDSHGAAPYPGEFLHSIAVDKRNVAHTVELSAPLKKIAEIAKEKEVKLAILDLSCYSGNTQKLEDENTCIISSTGPGSLSYKSTKSFSYYLLENLTHGKSLEEIFLYARNKSKDRSYPMISTTNRLQFFNLLYDTIRPYLNFKNDGESDSNQIFRNWLLTNSIDQYCKDMKNYDSLLVSLKQFEEDEKELSSIIMHLIFGTNEKYEEFKNFIKYAHDEYQKYAGEYLQYKNKLSQKIPVYYLDDKNNKKGFYYSMEQIFFSDYKVLLNKELNGANNINLINLYKSLIKKQNELKTKLPNLVSLEHKLKEVGKKIKDTDLLSAEIALRERELFQDVYEKIILKDNSVNPCRNFTL